jgi:hypothetical protein
MAKNKPNRENQIEKKAKNNLPFRTYEASAFALCDEWSKRRKRSTRALGKSNWMQTAETEAKYQKLSRQEQKVNNDKLKHESNYEGDYFHIETYRLSSAAAEGSPLE